MKVNPEFLPIIEWWEKDGRQLVLCLAIVAAAVGGCGSIAHIENTYRLLPRQPLI